MKCESARIETAETGLIHAAKSGDESAREKLAEQYKPLMWAIARRMPYSGMAFSELVQAGYLGFFQALNRFDPQRENLLITYAVPWIIGEMKKCSRRGYQLSDSISLENSEESEGVSLIERIAGGNEIDVEILDLRMAMSRLEPIEQNVICLRYFRDKTQTEVALLLGKSQTQISRIEQKAIQWLRAQLV